MKNKNLNRKGFTLIELLAVIVVLAILLLVSIPAVTGTLNNARRGTARDQAMIIAKAAETCYVSKISSNNSSDTVASDSCDTITELVDDGFYDGNKAKEKGKLTFSSGKVDSIYYVANVTKGSMCAAGTGLAANREGIKGGTLTADVTGITSDSNVNGTNIITSGASANCK